MNFSLNLLWLFFGGWTTAISWFTSALLMVISIVGIPWARAAFNISCLRLERTSTTLSLQHFPFGLVQFQFRSIFASPSLYELPRLIHLGQYLQLNI